jgi:ABC-type multidrug transport system permease subunit
MNTLKAIMAAFLQQWKTTATDIGSVSMLFETVPLAMALAWLAMKSPTPPVLTYLMVGAPLMSMCNGIVFRVGGSLNSELFGHTLDFALVSKTPMMVILFGKSLAQLVFRIPMGIITLLAMFIVTRHMPAVANMPLLLVSIIFVCVGLVAMSLLFAPFMVLVGGKAGFFNAIMPLAVVLSGFMFPINRLPVVLEQIARLMPTSWAMASIWQSINGTDSAWSFAANILACILTSILLLFITYFMCWIVERKLRVTGELATY